MEEKDRKLLRLLGVLSTMGIQLVFATVIGLFIGHWLDGKFNTTPWLTLLFLLFGLIAGFRNLVVYVKKSQETLSQDEGKDKK